ncbi:MAG: hypothetical protein J3K34DRAFT_494410 [Monoraphidium minutum]|nr:MAG: hypothetical protein J3K34DRAFT_494410 [Monoraphidium minutum]
MKSAAAALQLPLLLLLCAAAAARGGAPLPPPPPPHGAAGPLLPPQPLRGHGGRALKQLTIYASTPTFAGSASGALETNAQLGPDGTVRAAGGVSGAASAGISNPLLRALTLGGYDNRPEAATAAYVTSPLSLSSTLRPTISYGLAEARGDLISGAAGGFGAAEFAYNPASNNLGKSASVGAAAAANLLNAEELVEGSALPTPGSAGLSGAEFIGSADDQTRLGDARTSQMGQAIAYPFNLVNPVLTYGVAVANYDQAAPGGPLPAGPPPNLTPFCLNLFNFATLDDFEALIEDEGGLFRGGGDSSTGSSGAGGADEQSAAPKLPPFAEQLDLALQQGAPAALEFLNSTAAGQALLQRAVASPLARSLDGAARAAAGAAGAAEQKLSGPLQNLTDALGGLRGTVAQNASGLATSGAVAAIEAAEPLLRAAAGARAAVAEPLAAAGARLAARSFDVLVRQVEGMAEGGDKDAARAAVGARRGDVGARAARGAQEEATGAAGVSGAGS